MSYQEVIAARTADLQDGQMKAVEVGEKKILLGRCDGRYYAIACYCTHFGAPLDQGYLQGDRVVCPWHQAVFDLKSGDLLEPPALEALTSFEVQVRGDDVIILVPDDFRQRRLPKMSRRDAADPRSFVILGGGAAGDSAAQKLREAGFKGKITMITQEKRLPYDRTNLSKSYLQGLAKDEWMPLHPEAFYRDYDIEILTEKKVTEVQPGKHEITFKDKSKLKYDKLLLATGGAPRLLKVPGADLRNVFTLRGYDDAIRILGASPSTKRVVVVGASFIGMEAAHSLRVRKLDVTVVAPETIPFQKVFGAEIGETLQRLHEKQGTKFRMGATVAGLEGNGSVEQVLLADGERLPADLVIIGIGVKPCTEFLRGITLDADGGLPVNAQFEAAEDLYAAGDIASFPNWRDGTRMRIEHWRTAQQQGRIAALNMLGQRTEFRDAPFFWTSQVGCHLRYVGHAEKWDEVLISGDLSKQDFIAYFVKDGVVLAAAGIRRDREISALRERMRLTEKLTPADVRTGF
jgi:NADPH-dependent 2,4-dienoyl-CoA reductase/sulfur reductase-like enzyme/nitrite reductase/ring-hydroxylating ferredoxin subunit